MIWSVELRLISLELAAPFRTSFGEEVSKECVLVRVEAEDGTAGWGECVAFQEPRFNEEYNEDAWHTIRTALAPAVLSGADDPEAFGRAVAWVRGHRMAKAAVETALLDAALRRQGRSLRAYLGGIRDRVKVGVSIGIQISVEATLQEVARHLEDGYGRIKLKIEPGWDREPVRAVRQHFPEIALSVDANAAYLDPEPLEEMDDLGLLMIEQPFPPENLLAHAELQGRIETPVCLDESIRSVSDVVLALRLEACRIVNVKPGRVGGYLEARRIHDACVEAGIPVWCGGMFETGIGRAGNLALASLPGFTLPGDISESRRYFRRDLTEEFRMAGPGEMEVPDGPGLGVEPNAEVLEEATVRRERIEKK